MLFVRSDIGKEPRDPGLSGLSYTVTSALALGMGLPMSRQSVLKLRNVNPPEQIDSIEQDFHCGSPSLVGGGLSVLLPSSSRYLVGATSLRLVRDART